jgi:hypothetical protein
MPGQTGIERGWMYRRNRFGKTGNTSQAVLRQAFLEKNDRGCGRISGAMDKSYIWRLNREGKQNGAGKYLTVVGNRFAGEFQIAGYLPGRLFPAPHGAAAGGKKGRAQRPCLRVRVRSMPKNISLPFQSIPFQLRTWGRPSLREDPRKACPAQCHSRNLLQPDHRHNHRGIHILP